MMSPSGDILPLFGVIVPLRPKNLLCRPLQPKASLQGHVAALLRHHAAFQSCRSALSSSSAPHSTDVYQSHGVTEG